MSKIRLLLWTSLILSSATVSAQDFNVITDTIRWTSNSYLDSTLNSSGITNDVFITYGTSKVKWLPPGGESQLEVLYDVDHIDDSWTSGVVIYYLNRNNRQRQLKIEYTTSLVRLIFSYTDGVGRQRIIKYTISKTEKIHS